MTAGADFVTISQSYFENFYPAYSRQSVLSTSADGQEAIFKPIPRRGGLGDDFLLGGIGVPGIRVIDLSELEIALKIDFTSPNSGTITDGIDTIVFQDIDEIILAPEMLSSKLPSPPVGQGRPVRVRLAEQALPELPYLPA